MKSNISSSMRKYAGFTSHYTEVKNTAICLGADYIDALEAQITKQEEELLELRKKYEALCLRESVRFVKD